ncbi:MAG: carbohydrate kinase [Pseudomonadota bacterium]
MENRPREGAEADAKAYAHAAEEVQRGAAENMILCCGEALIDMIPQALPSGQQGFQPCPGGAVFNTSIGLGRLGADVAMLTALSQDMFGDQLITELEASRVETAHILRLPHPSTLAFVTLQDGHARYAFFDEGSAESQLRTADVPDLPDAVTALYFGGISLAREPGGAFYAELARRAGAGRLVMVDPNIRIGFVRDQDAYRARLAQMFGLADIVKVSDEDLMWILPDAPSLETGVHILRAEMLRAEGPKLVILTQGAKGASAWGQGLDRIEVPAATVEVADTVGAGDSFNAGVLASLQAQGAIQEDGTLKLERPIIEQALRFAAQVAGITVSRVGANPPWGRELDAAAAG